MPDNFISYLEFIPDSVWVPRPGELGMRMEMMGQGVDYTALRASFLWLY